MTVVLLVDDDPLVLGALGRTLRGAGLDTRDYTDPVVALASLAVEQPDVVVADQVMPQMTGVAFLEEARTRAPSAVRILCTAADDFAVAREAVNSGEVYRIVSKPCHPGDLVTAVQQAAEAARLHRENARLTVEVRRQNELLRDMNVRLEEIARERSRALLEGLIAALDYRDAETQWHSRRVSLYARRLARELGIGEPDISTIEHGALLHDIGKIGVRDSVLLKPGPLTPAEWVEMQKHVEIGWGILQRVEHLRPASSIVLQHQERWDGSGYPAGLKEEAITIGARIFHVVDAVDAITSERPYRRSRSFAEAQAEVLRCSGSQFDPRVVDAFLAVPADEWNRIRIDVETVAVLTSELAPAAPIAPPRR